ncbi:445_t:CDS:2, partial [Cetraspora pellucida]
CIRKYDGLGATQLKPECCTVNRACLCRNHLSKCKAFHETNKEEEVQRVLALPGANDISLKRLQTQNVINHIEQLIVETEEKQINIKAFISDFTGEYAAAW